MDITWTPHWRNYQGNVLLAQGKSTLVQGEGGSLIATFRVDSPLSHGTRVAVGVTAFVPVDDLHIAIPAAIYNGNEFRSKPFAYPCIVCDPEDFRADLPNTISNVPRLPHLQILTGDTATPAIGCFDAVSKQGLWIVAEQETEWGQNLLEVRQVAGGCELSVFTPGVREGLRYHGCGYDWLPSDDLGADPRVGQELALGIRVFQFPAKSVADLYDRLLDVRRCFGTPPPRHELPWSTAMEIIERKYNATNWDEEYGYYASGDRQSRYAQWQVGWVGGMISSFALYAAGCEESQGRAMRNIDYLTVAWPSRPCVFEASRLDNPESSAETAMPRLANSPSGFYWSVGIDGEMYSDMVDMDYGHDWHLIRRSGDALYFTLKQIEVARRRGVEPKPEWLESLRLCADAFVRLWDREGQFGQFVSQETGEIRVGGTTSGGIAPAGLALASITLDNPEYLRVAQESSRAMVERFVDNGYTSGGPGEAAQCPDSESAFGLLESLVTLYEVTGDPAWLDPARKAANLCASWVMSYDFRFPPESSFGKLDMRTTGSVWANVQNKHSAPGICTLSGVSLFKLFRATGDRRYLDLLKDIAHGVTQYLSRDDRPVFDMPEGWMCERVNTSDWEAPGTPVGEGFRGSCWCEISAMLTYAEIPGLYVQPDTGLICMMDHGDAVVVETTEEEMVVEVSNGTPFPMDLSVFTENSHETTTPLGQDFLQDAPRITIPPQAKQQLRFPL